MANQSKILKAQWEDLKTQIGTALLPVVLELTKGLNSLAGTIISDVVPVVKEWYEKHQPEINAQMEEFKTVLREDVMPAIEALVELFQTLWPILGPLVETVFKDMLNTITTQLKVIADVIKIVTAIISGDWSGAWDGMKQLAVDVWDGIYTHIALKVALVRDVVVFGLTFAKNIAVAVMNEARDGITAAWQSIKDSVTGFIQDIIDKIQALIDKAKDIANIGGIPGKIFGKVMDQFAEGGVSSGGLALVGERGPELVNLPGGSYVHSNAESRQMASAGGGGTTIINVYPQNIILQGDAQAGLASMGGMFA